MYLDGRPEQLQKLRSVGRSFVATVILGLVIGVDVTQPDITAIRLVYIPAILAATWLAGSPLVLAILAGSLALKLKGAGGTSGADLLIAPEQFSDTVIWFAECSTISVLTFLLRRSRERGHLSADRDPLTGLPNRAALNRRLEAEINRSRRTGRPLTLAVLDCDRFKEVNDTLGHVAGDALLREVANAFQSNIRNYDLAARIGGDEFAVVLPETSSSGAQAVFERIRRGLRTAAATGRWPITVSIGVATSRQPTESPDDLLAIADQAMYAAKRTMRGSVRFIES